MPIIKSARKKMRQDKKRRSVNLKTLGKLKRVLSGARKQLTASGILKTQSAIDRAAKKNLIHKNKAARLKSRLAKKLKNQKSEKTVVKPSKKKKN